MTRWATVATDFHEQVRANCWDSLAGRLLILHQPHLDKGHPVCDGCDRSDARLPRPNWPCRTYETIAATMLGVTTIEAMLKARLAHAEAQLTPPEPPVQKHTDAAAPDQSAPAEARTGRTRSGRSKN